MKYERKSFSIASPGTAAYASNWERTFRGEDRANYPAVWWFRIGRHELARSILVRAIAVGYLDADPEDLAAALAELGKLKVVRPSWLRCYLLELPTLVAPMQLAQPVVFSREVVFEVEPSTRRDVVLFFFGDYVP